MNWIMIGSGMIILGALGLGAAAAICIFNLRDVEHEDH